jgi:LmbE family N-acetylglucosaminyl deacetylase
MTYEALVIAADADDAEKQMGGTLAKLTDRGQRILLVDRTDGEPTEFAEPGVRARQAAEAARILGVDRCTLGVRDRLLQDAPELRLASLIRRHQPRWVYGTGEACVHPDHAATVGLTRAAVFLARLGQWDRVPSGESAAVPSCELRWWSTRSAVSPLDKRRHHLCCKTHALITEFGGQLPSSFEVESAYHLEDWIVFSNALERLTRWMWVNAEVVPRFRGWRFG